MVKILNILLGFQEMETKQQSINTLMKIYSIEKGITYYYQLKQIDYDGQYEYFDIKPVRLSGPSKYSEILSIKYYSYLGEEFNIKPNLKNYIKCISYPEGTVCEKIYLK
jgi:hypothetical protein